ncbi:methylmalonyl-CoA mutase [bacterium]|nr:methylmalonyl-CoA mutase [bacterium]
MTASKFRERKEVFKTDSGIELKPFYKPNPDFNYDEKLGVAGEMPFTRGVQPTMFRGKFWTMRQYAGFASAEESNKRYRYLLEQGTTGLSVAFDLPTQMGYDSDDTMSLGEVGKVGVAIDSLADVETLFDKIPLEKVSTSMTINATAGILLCLYVAVAKKQGADLKKLSGTIQNDILKEYIARGTYIFPPKPSMRLITDIFAYCSENLPEWNTISISGYHIREAGSTAVQELAFTFANAIAYAEAAIKAGLDVDVFGKRLSFFFNAHNNFFEEIAKFRAARRIWAKIITQKFHAKDTQTMKLRFHTQTAGSTLTAQQPDNNIVRVTLQALSAVLGGTQSLHTNSKDEALALPTQSSARLALRTQQIIAYESGVTDTIDPLAGSYFVENLTDEIEAKVWDYLEKIEKIGGSIAGIETEFFQREIAQAAYRYQLDIESKEKIIVGVNDFQMEEHNKEDLLKIDESVATKQVEKLKKLRETRNNEKVSNLLKTLQETAKTDKNLIPVILDCVENYVTLGEISHALRKVFGVYQG